MLWHNKPANTIISDQSTITSSTGLMNISGSSSHFYPPLSLWTTSMMSWLLWPSLERFPTPSMMLYAPSQSWTSLTSNQSSNHSETWTRCVQTSLEHLQPFLRSQLHRSRPKSFLNLQSLRLLYSPPPAPHSLLMLPLQVLSPLSFNLSLTHPGMQIQAPQLIWPSIAIGCIIFHLADGSVLYSEGIGSVRFIPDVNGCQMVPLEFTNVLYVPSLSTNLFSVLYLTIHCHITVLIELDIIHFIRDGQRLSFKQRPLHQMLHIL